MILAAAPVTHFDSQTIVATIAVGLLSSFAVYLGARPLGGVIRGREREYDLIFRRALLMDIHPRVITAGTALVMVVMGLLLYAVVHNMFAVPIGLLIGALLPHALIRHLRRRRVKKLEEQLVGGIQSLSSGVRAGLNLVQSLGLVARDGPNPIRQEFSHLVREYEYGVPLDEAMDNAADRIGSSDFRLLFAALHTHRERGGDLGETLDRIADSIREIQRLEKQVETLTAQGRATARWLGAMPAVVLGILYLINPAGVTDMFIKPFGNLLLLAIVVLTVLGFIWIRKVIAIDI